MEVEARPIEMLGRRMDDLLRDARGAVARFVGTAPDQLGFVTNATEGVHAVLRSIDWKRGDEIVTTDHVYGAMRQSIRRLADEFGVVLREVAVPLPVSGPDEFLAPVIAAFSARTRLLLIDHITSPTALVLPVVQLAETAKARGILVLIDGAHAPGSIDLDIKAIPCDAYTGNLHKWVCAPKGCAFVAGVGAFAERLKPIATSHRYGEGLVREFDWQGTRDMTPWLTAPAALQYFDRIGGDRFGGDRIGWERVRRHNHDLAVWAMQTLVEQWSVESLSPLDGSMLASMAAIPVPAQVQQRFASEVALQAHLYDVHRIEIPVIDWKGRWHVRVSCHLHTTPDLIERLGVVVRSLADGGDVHVA
jgi:isopenicillin-N epimerase